MTILARLPGLLTLIAIALLAQGCAISAADVSVTPLAGAISGQPLPASALPIVGPVPGSSHWHAAYIVRICDDVLEPFDSANDPLGIHSHAEGLMHVHPFFQESGYESATLGLFADAMGLGLREGELTLPGGGTWRDGDECNGVPSRVFVDRWRDPTTNSSIERIFTNPEELRYLADGELYQIAFAPVDSPPVVPPAAGLLPQVSNLAPPPDPWIDVDPTATIDDVRIWEVAAVSTEPCGESAVPERVLSGVVRCFEPAGPAISGSEAITSARAVLFNRNPAIDMRIGAELQQLIAGHFQSPADPLVLAIEVDGFVLTAPLIASRPVSRDRLVVSGGLSVETATQLADILGG